MTLFSRLLDGSPRATARCRDGKSGAVECAHSRGTEERDIRCEMPDPKIEDSRDAIIKVTGCAICGSDLHIFDGLIPSMDRGDVMGHETPRSRPAEAHPAGRR